MAKVLSRVKTAILFAIIFAIVGCDSFVIPKAANESKVSNSETEEIVRKSEVVSYNQPICEINPQQKAIISGSVDGNAKSNAAFRVTHVRDSQYVVDFNSTFIARDGSSETRKKMINKVNKCFERANPFLLGPKGEQIQFRLSQDREVPVSKILIELDQIRASSHYFYVEMPCTSIIHEYLHFVGLVDEYQEKLLVVQEGPIFNCRSIGPEDSVMRDPKLAASNLVGSKTAVISLEGYHAMDLSGEINVIDFVENDPEDRARLDRKAKSVADFNKVARYKMDFKESPQATKKSLLKPAHFRMITQPSCGKSNATYMACGSNSRRTQYPNYSLDNYVRMEVETGEPNCLPVADICSTTNWLN